jgi:FkbM family methyltransferase
MKKAAKYIYNLVPFKKQLFAGLRKTNLPENVFKHLYFTGIFKVKFESYLFLIKHYGFQLENEIFWKGLTNGWEKISTRLWIELSKDSDVILDIGANTGIYSLVSKSVNENAKVYAFEPVKRVFEKLCDNNALNNYDINCYELAISNNDGEAIIYDTLTPHIYSVAVNKNISGLANTVETKIVTQKLSSFIEEQKLSKIDLIKIDVETHEPEVLEGMGDFLKRYKPTILIEILNDEVGAKVQQLVSGIDYMFFNIDEINPPKKVDTIKKSDYYNYLICSPEIAKKLKLIH